MASTLDNMRPHTQFLRCPRCEYSIEYWLSRPASEMFPHFCCNQCSNVIWRREDRDVLVDPALEENFALKRIADSLPECECGGRFSLGTGPKCPRCHYHFEPQGSLLLQAHSPIVILVEGAKLLEQFVGYGNPLAG